MEEIKINGQKLTRKDQQAVIIGLINRALALLDENSLMLFLENIDIDAEKDRTNFLMSLAMKYSKFSNSSEEFIINNEEHKEEK